MRKSMKTPNNQSEIHAGSEWCCMLLMSCDVLTLMIHVDFKVRWYYDAIYDM